MNCSCSKKPSGQRRSRDYHALHIRFADRLRFDPVQVYRHELLLTVARYIATLGVIKPMRFEKPVEAGAFATALNHQGSVTFLDQYLNSKPKRKPRLGGAPKVITPDE
jgi:hypothetical protein